MPLKTVTADKPTPLQPLLQMRKFLWEKCNHFRYQNKNLPAKKHVQRKSDWHSSVGGSKTSKTIKRLKSLTWRYSNTSFCRTISFHSCCRWENGWHLLTYHNSTTANHKMYLMCEFIWLLSAYFINCPAFLKAFKYHTTQLDNFTSNWITLKNLQAVLNFVLIHHQLLYNG